MRRLGIFVIVYCLFVFAAVRAQQSSPAKAYVVGWNQGEILNDARGRTTAIYVSPAQGASDLSFMFQDMPTAPASSIVMIGPRRFFSSMKDPVRSSSAINGSGWRKAARSIGTNDTLASPGAQLDYYASILATMGRADVDRFARLFVMPQAGHGLTGTSDTTDGNGRTIAATPIPNRYDQWGLLFDWVEKGTAPPMSVVLTADDRSLPLCSSPSYPRYTSGPVGEASSSRCAQ